jgi:probable F420-dependent oxidoreductase
MGYTHLLAYDHVLGADTSIRPNWTGTYDLHSLFHEPFVLFGYLAGLTRSLELVTGVIILPQRQTALVAKQAAEVDVLSGGRLRLGVGLGWNAVEYEALGERFENRGRRIVEQIEVLRALFTQESVTFHGRWHTIEAAGINPLPVQRPIPIWIGGSVDAALRRAATLGDGWFPLMPPDRAAPMIEQLHQYAREAGRDPAEIGVDARVNIRSREPDGWAETVERWRSIGATHLNLNTMGAGFGSPQEHLDALRRFQDTVG